MTEKRIGSRSFRRETAARKKDPPLRRRTAGGSETEYPSIFLCGYAGNFSIPAGEKGDVRCGALPDNTRCRRRCPGLLTAKIRAPILKAIGWHGKVFALDCAG